MKNMRLIVNLTQAWVHKKFNDNFVEQWMARPGKWNRTVPGSPKSHESTQLVEISVIHPSNDKVKYPQGNLCNYDGIFASCLHYKGMTREAESIIWFAGSCIMQQKLIIFHNMVVKACKGYTLVCFRELNFKQDDKLFKRSIISFTEWEDAGSCDHAITVYKQRHALWCITWIHSTKMFANFIDAANLSDSRIYFNCIH